MPLFILDTDHITLLERGHSQVIAHFDAVSDESIAASVISFEEQVPRVAIVLPSACRCAVIAPHTLLGELVANGWHSMACRAIDNLSHLC